MLIILNGMECMSGPVIVICVVMIETKVHMALHVRARIIAMTNFWTVQALPEQHCESISFCHFPLIKVIWSVNIILIKINFSYICHNINSNLFLLARIQCQLQLTKLLCKLPCSYHNTLSSHIINKWHASVILITYLYVMAVL